MKSLLERELMAAKVQTVCVDPPYGVTPLEFRAAQRPVRRTRSWRCARTRDDARGGSIINELERGGFCRSNARTLALVSYGARR